MCPHSSPRGYEQHPAPLVDPQGVGVTAVVEERQHGVHSAGPALQLHPSAGDAGDRVHLVIMTIIIILNIILTTW